MKALTRVAALNRAFKCPYAPLGALKRR
jgi:hypothetical protein